MDGEIAHWHTRTAVAWTTRDARNTCLADWQEELGPSAGPHPRWYVVDAVEAGGLQLVVRAEEPVPDVAEPPAMLESSWYPGGITPEVLPSILSVLTEVVVARTLSVGSATGCALAEVAAVFAALVPSDERSLAFERAGAWLDRVADRLGTPPGAPDEQRAVPIPPTADLVARLVPFARALSDHSAMVGPPANIAPAEARDRIVARVAHSTALLAELCPGDLRREASFVRALQQADQVTGGHGHT